MKRIFSVSIWLCFTIAGTSQNNVLTYKDVTYLDLPKHSTLVSCLQQFHWYEEFKTESSLVRIIERELVSDHLEFDLYNPTVGDNHPLLVFMHSGAFVLGNKSDSEMQQLGQAFAEKGIAFASIEYRTKALPLLSVTDAGYLAIQDLAAAVGFFKSQSDKYNISKDNIFVGGTSSGAITALHFAYLDEDEFDPEGYAFLDEKFGCLKCNGITGGDLDIRGVISLNGAVMDLDILLDESIPLLQFVGQKDKILNPDTGKPFKEYFTKPNSEMSLTQAFLSIIGEEWSLRMFDFIDNVIDIPQTKGGIAIEEFVTHHNLFQSQTKVFPFKDHRLLVSQTDNRRMSSFENIVNMSVRGINESAIEMEEEDFFSRLWNRIKSLIIE